MFAIFVSVCYSIPLSSITITSNQAISSLLEPVIVPSGLYHYRKYGMFDHQSACPSYQSERGHFTQLSPDHGVSLHFFSSYIPFKE